VASVGGLSARAELPKTAVYEMVKASWENVDARKGPIPIPKRVSLDTVFLDPNAPLHPGAIRYYRGIDRNIPEAGLAQP
jgi:TRAP-type uncharacterized transport system substrate-binding protein